MKHKLTVEAAKKKGMSLEAAHTIHKREVAEEHAEKHEMLVRTLEKGPVERREARRLISLQHKQELEKKKFIQEHPENYGPVMRMREKILMLSLFPNIYNRKMMSTEYGAE